MMQWYGHSWATGEEVVGEGQEATCPSQLERLLGLQPGLGLLCAAAPSSLHWLEATEVYHWACCPLKKSPFEWGYYYSWL